MKVAYTQSTQFKVRSFIEKLSGDVVLRSEVAKLGSPRQVSRALKKLVEEGAITKLGYGVYAKLNRSPLVKRPFLQAGFSSVTKEALNKLKVEWEMGLAEKAYNAGLTTQIPVNATMRLKSRFNRKLAYRGMKLEFENNMAE